MAIKLNGTEITINKLNGTSITEEKLNGTVVYPQGTLMAQWQYVTYYSSEQHNEDLFISLNVGSYQQGLIHLNSNYPAENYYEGFIAVIHDLGTGNYIEYVVVLVPKPPTKWQYVGYSSNVPNNHDLLINTYIYGNYEQGIDYLNNNYPSDDYEEGFVAVIADGSTLGVYFTYVVILI